MPPKYTGPVIRPTEHEIQCAAIQWWAYACKGYGLPEFSLYAIPNAGAGAQKGQAGKMKAEGVRSGVPDLFLAVPRPVCPPPGAIVKDPGVWSGLYIETKSYTGRLSVRQRDVGHWLQSRGYVVVECRSVHAIQTAIVNYLSYLK